MSRKYFVPLGAALALFGAPAASGYQVVTDRHADLQIVYASGSITGRVNPDAASYERNDALLFDGPIGTTAVERPNGQEWDFLGVSAGQIIHYLPQGYEEDRLYLGFASDKNTVPFGVFATYFESDPRVAGSAAWNRITLLDVRFVPAPGETPGPAYFSLWQNDFDGNTTVWMSSFLGGITEEDSTWLAVGGHSHYNWGFSKRGYYQIDFKFSGRLNDGNQTLLESDTLTYHFGIEFMPVHIPEPGSAALFISGALLLAVRRRRSGSYENRG